MDPNGLNYIINHLFLPPKLPQKDDSAFQHELLKHIANCAKSFYDGLASEDVAAETRWAKLRLTLECFANIHESPQISRESLEAAIKHMQPDDVLCLHIVSQNAGVILRRREKDLSVEFFPASASNAVVTGTTGKLIVQFPSRPRLSLPINDALVKSLSALLADLDCTCMEDAIPKSQKAGAAQDEIRDVADIRYVSEVLGGIARGLATSDGDMNATAENTVYVAKRINDHVLWHSALLPWRRSPKWLILRVVLQTTLKQWEMREKYGYKAFITFVLAKTLELARTADVSHDLLFVMSAKVSTRAWKLRSVFDVPTSSCPPFPFPFIDRQMRAVSLLLNNRWKGVQDREGIPSVWAAPTLTEIAAAQTLTLPRSSAHFEIVQARTSTLNAEQTSFDLDVFEDHLRSQVDAQKQAALSPGGVASPDIWSRLLVREEWIANWTDASSPQQLSILAALIEEHEALAASFKSRNPEIFSRIFLLVLELWVALDKSATSQFPLLLDYSPELFISSFEPLLLPQLGQMRRLRAIELYVTKRRTNARYPHLSVFTFNTDSNSLPSRHFARDSNLQSLRREIEVQASQCRDQKIQELHEKSSHYTAILRESERQECLYFTNRWGEYKHDWWHCVRCAKKEEARDMSITVFEWPLPEDDARCRLVLFELCLPVAFGIWRDTTYRLARNHSNILPQTSPTPAVVIRGYDPLKHHFTSNTRITIASTAKSFLDSHYKKHSFPCADSDVILNHPLRYQFWDAIASEWLPFEFPIIDIREYCTPEFPSGPYLSLTWTAVSTTHTPNTVIARQSECSADLSYHEWEAFGHLRAGVRLQWRNIMLQVITGVINLADPAVHLLFQQAAWQVETALDHGELSHYREAHFDLSQEDFGLQIVDVLHRRLESISGNWKEGWAAATLGVIACRLFSLNEFERVKAKALEFLSRLRKILFEWMKEVLVLLNNPSVAESSAWADLVNRVLQLAASCRSTYSVGSDSLRGLFHDRATSAIFIRCGITLHTYTPPKVSSLPSALRYLLEHDTIISAEALTLLIDAISQSGDGLDNAVLGIWQGYYRDADPWRNVGGRWMRCKTSTSSDRQVRYVHINLLNGSFLVDGRAQGTIPKDISGHHLFLALFPNQSALNVIPSTMKGMDYQSRENMNAFEVHFKLRGDELLIRTRDGSNSVSEFIPPKRLEGDIPTDLLVNMVHIFHEGTRSMDIYPAPSGWQPLARAAWRLDLGPRSLSKMSDDAAVEAALDPASSLVEKVAEIFRPLEASKTNLTLYSRFEGLHVSLPRYNLEFSVGPSGLLESKELPGFYVSPTQSIGTLIGLQSKLVLKSHKGEMTKVFIPEGKVTVLYGGGDHPKVAISPFVASPGHHIKTFSYDIDDIMGRVIGDGSLTSWYRLAYLHIVTSSHLCDPLIHRTGIEQAQDMLGSAQSFAFMGLKQEHNDLLQQILDLAPIRKYYPEHLKTMETIQWLDFLPPLTQCGRFVPLVDAILDYAGRQTLFYSPEYRTTIKAAYQGELCLWKRAEYRVARLVSNVQIDECDIPALPARCLDCSESVAREQLVAEIVAEVRQWPVFVNTKDDLWSHFERWESFSSEPVADNKIDDPRVWLQDPPSDAWFRLFHLSRAAVKDRDQYGLMVALGILAYRRDLNLDLIRTLLAIATNAPTNLTPISAAVQSIPKDTFNLASGHTLNLSDILNLARESCRSFADVDAASLGLAQNYGETHEVWTQRKQSTFRSKKEAQCGALAGRILPHWPVPGTAASNLTVVPDMASILPYSLSGDYPIVNIESLRTEAQALFTIRLRNRRMFESVGHLQHALNTVRVQGSRLPTGPIASPSSPISTAVFPKYESLTLASLLERRTAPNITSESSASRQLIFGLEALSMDGPKSQYIDDLSRCVDAFEGRNPDHRTAPNITSESSASRQLIFDLEALSMDGPKSQYINDLSRCVDAFEGRNPDHRTAPNITSESSASRQLIFDLEALSMDGPKSQYINNLSRCVDAFEGRNPDYQGSSGGGYQQDCSRLQDLIQNVLGPKTIFEQWLYQTGQWPSTGPESLVRQLSREARQVLPESWKINLSRYAEGIAGKQQQRRIAALSRPGSEWVHAREVATRGGEGWDATEHLDWLLVQLDADLLIRAVQASIAEQMMSPEGNKNALMQLNMGEGKSSVIVPIVSVALANGEQLVRVVVLKPLSAQMFQLLKQRVCGLANRRLFFLPFSRDIPLDPAKIQKIVGLLKECARVGGILLCQPEHILSFQLMGLHAFCQSEVSEEARMLREAQEWLDSAARDILDESDEILNVRYQLIYTLGAANPLEGRPWRWNISQAVFSLLEKLTKTPKNVPDGLEITTFPEARRFPLTRILTPNGRQALLKSIVDEIVFEDGLQEWISFRTHTRAQKMGAYRFLNQWNIEREDVSSLRNLPDDQFSQLLLLRGLFAHGILSLSLEGKRWRVDYGLDPRRSMLAVPYRAKDSPAPRAEFGHPDMIIVLTCLSYYYGGLTDEQLNTTFRLLLNSENPEAQYERWVEGINNLPANLANLRGLNLDDLEQKTSHIFPLLRYNKAVIDFYLSECVFPKEAREYPHKLTTNAWDLARTKARLTTGFSGTNDNKYLLPFSIEQLDQGPQRHTNAQVLEYILQPENRSVLCTDSDNARGLLQRVVEQKPCVMVLLDVGAQVLELQNEEVAREWLKLDSRPHVEAAVFFDPSSDEIRVISRDGRIQPLASSLYKTQLQKTLVYLDEVHTRGTDFKFPAGSRAVVTLGPKLTKDKLVQGCMRMRRLGKDHSVLFFASAEIWSKIKTATKAQNLNSDHVLLWTITETCMQIRDNGSLWANQGLNFDARRTALDEYPERPYRSVVNALQERESRTLEELYGEKAKSGNEKQTNNASQLEIEIRRKCKEFGIDPSHSALSEEQERELAHEKEDERELERIPNAKPLNHRNNNELRHFINTGAVNQPNNFISLESCLANTSCISLLPEGTIFRGQDLRATRDFRDTISLSPTYSTGSMDYSLRPVQWILSTSRSDFMMIISPFEANKWLSEIRRSQFVSLHLYSPRVSRNAFWSFEGLDSFTVPCRRRAPNRELIHELNLFAGQLFCADKPSVKKICSILGLHLQPVNDDEGLEGMVDSMGFVLDKQARTALRIDACTFDSTPLPFFRGLFASRRKGQGIALAHMGQILRGNDPKDADFEETD
ncbi:hypothetical protein FB451DRAFT_1555198 [Mycena latifolia]|nr:hypothetical protein FB451DRAFT_1555198 [Mycena latifolia]